MSMQGIHQAPGKLRVRPKSGANPSMRNYDTLMHIARDLRHLPRSVLVSSLVINVLGLGLPLVTDRKSVV